MRQQALISVLASAVFHQDRLQRKGVTMGHQKEIEEQAMQDQGDQDSGFQKI